MHFLRFSNGVNPLNAKYQDIELKKGIKYRIVGELVKKGKRYQEARNSGHLDDKAILPERTL